MREGFFQKGPASSGLCSVGLFCKSLVGDPHPMEEYDQRRRIDSDVAEIQHLIETSAIDNGSYRDDIDPTDNANYSSSTLNAEQEAAWREKFTRLPCDVKRVDPRFKQATFFMLDKWAEELKSYKHVNHKFAYRLTRSIHGPPCDCVVPTINRLSEIESGLAYVFDTFDKETIKECLTYCLISHSSWQHYVFCQAIPEEIYREFLPWIIVMNSATNFVITGAAGTGKSATLRVARTFSERMGKKTFTFAPTGTAAFKIGNAKTIHYGLGINPSHIKRIFATDATQTRLAAENFVGQYKGMKSRKYQKYGDEAVAAFYSTQCPWTMADIVFFDEFSMITQSLFNFIDQAFRVFRQIESPFGGVQVVFLGDALQLAPINKGEDTKDNGKHNNPPHNGSNRNAAFNKLSKKELQVTKKPLGTSSNSLGSSARPQPPILASPISKPKTQTTITNGLALMAKNATKHTNVHTKQPPKNDAPNHVEKGVDGTPIAPEKPVKKILKRISKKELMEQVKAAQVPITLDEHMEATTRMDDANDSTPSSVCFDTDAWWNTFDIVIQLEAQMRQKSDEKYGAVLAHMRTGELTDADYVTLKNYGKHTFDFHRDVVWSDIASASTAPLMIFCHSTRVANFNQEIFARNTEFKCTYKSVVGIEEKLFDRVTNRFSWHSLSNVGDAIDYKSLPESIRQQVIDYKSPVHLKAATRVMLTVNLDPVSFPGCTNGAFGTVIGFDSQATVLVEGVEVERPVVKFDDGPVVSLDTHSRTFEFSNDGQDFRLVISNIPLELAYASSVHKVQGSTMENGVVINTNGFWELSLFYVACSRCRNAKNLYFESLDLGLLKGLKMEPNSFAYYQKLKRKWKLWWETP